MPSKACKLFAALLSSALFAEPLVADPLKKAPTRRGYDFTRPDPSEILPNPTEGVGPPPQLRTYVTVKEMSSAGSRNKAPAAPSFELQSSEPEPAPGDKQASQAPGPPAVPEPPSAPAADAWRSSQKARVSRHIESVLASQIGTSGIQGTFVYQPSSAAQSDPSLLASEKRTWDRMVQSLATSWKTWQTAHATMASPDEVTSASATPAAHAPSAQPTVTVQKAPGLIVLRGAPPSVTGDFADIRPDQYR